MNVRFDQPELLLLAAFIVPLILIGWKSLAAMDSLRRTTALSLRTLLLLSLCIVLAGPRVKREHNHLTVIGLLDISGSVRRFANLPALALEDSEEIVRSNIEYLRRWFRRATQTKAPDDRFGLIVFDGDAAAISVPAKSEYVDDNLDVEIAPGTNIAEAVTLALAMFPPDTAKRLILVTDGNQTAGDVMAVVNRAVSGNVRIQNEKIETVTIPIDILPISYSVTGDVQIARLETPATALPEQTITVRVILESASESSGLLTLRHEGISVDINGNEPGTSRSITIPAGQSVHLANVSLGETPINRFEAIFEADDPTTDVLPDNNRAEAFTATPSRGSVLILDNQINLRRNLLAEILNESDLPASAQLPAQLPASLLSLQNYDLIVLDNVAAHELTVSQQELLARYVNDLGGGLIMIGGENSFGAGGWTHTPVADILPINLDPSKELRLPSAALVLVLDKSGSMNAPVAGARATQQEVANEGAALAIESMRSDSLVGVITFDMFSHTLVPLQRNDDSKAIAKRVRGITAEGGTNLVPALWKAYEMLRDVNVEKKRVVCLSDGQSHSTDFDEVVQSMNQASIQLTTIAVGDDADYETLHDLAERGNGEFYPVRDPRTLPRVLVDSVQIINKPLIKEESFVPRIIPTGSTLTAGMDDAPPLNGLVMTSPRSESTAVIEMIHPDGEPVLAHWQAGLGRAAAFTSDIGGIWSREWDQWPTAIALWTQLARMIARPATQQNSELTATIKGETLHITLDLPAESDSPFQYVNVNGTVYLPDGETRHVQLKQIGPERYEATTTAMPAGNYVVALSPRRGSRSLAPIIGGVSKSSSPEFRKYNSNISLLNEIAQATHGRQLDVQDPTAQSLFDRSSLPVSVSLLPIWKTLLWLLLCISILDIACRRIAWDANLLRQFARQMLARVTPAHLRGAEAAATLASLRQVSGQRATRGSREATQKTTTRPRDVSGTRKQPAIDDPQLTETPEPSKVAAALDALFGRSKSREENPVSPDEDRSTRDTPEPETDRTRHLLAAKRRALKRYGPPEQPQSGGDDSQSE